MNGSTYDTPGSFAISAIAASSRIRVGVTFVGSRGPWLSPPARRPPDGRSRLPAATAVLLPNTGISLNRSRPLKGDNRFLLRPKLNDPIVTITAAPTKTPIHDTVSR